MPDPLSVVGAGLALGGALFGKNPPAWGPRAVARRSLLGAFRAADQHGIHRLAVTGSPAGYSPAPASGGQDLMAAGAAVRNLGLEAKEKELIDAQIEEARSRTILNEANARRAIDVPQPGLGGASPRLSQVTQALPSFHKPFQGPERPIVTDPERDMPISNKVAFGRDSYNIPNPDAFEVGLSELIAGGVMIGPQWVNARIKDIRRMVDEMDLKETADREVARRAASQRERDAQKSPYLFPRRN